MSVLLEHNLKSIVLDFDALIARCDLLGLTEVSKRLRPIRDVIQQGIELRAIVQAARGDTDEPRGTM